MTFVITDIEGSTRLLRTLGETYANALARHHQLLRTVWADHGGAEVNTEGDSFIVAFGDPTSAVRACAAALLAIDDEDWGEHPFRVRVGAHCGPARPRDGDYVALALHQTARVAGAANGRQAIVTTQVLDEADLGDDVVVTGVGRYRLRDFDSPVELHLVEPTGFDREPIPLRALPAEHHNLPHPPAPIFDRVDELVRLGELVEPRTLTTLWGAGGVGKTRLVTEFGRCRAGEWPDGIWMARLAAIRSAGELTGAIAQSLGIPLTGADDPTRQLIQALAGRRCVLILDNCEHLARAVASLVEEVRTSCQSLALLATSRTPIGVLAERRLGLRPFASEGSGDELGPSVELFRLRAAEVGGAIDDLEMIGLLCDRLDGLPLAIELAAARSDVMSPAEMLAGLDGRLGSLRLSDPALPAHQQSMDATIDWSYDLLSVAEQAALRRLTVLRSSFDIDAAIAVCGDGDLDVDVAELVWSLVSSSVIDRHPDEAETRFRLYSTLRMRVREHADERELTAAAQRAAAHFDEIVGPHRAAGLGWASKIEVELGNLRELIDPAAGVDDGLRLRLLWSVGMLHDVKDEFALGIEELQRLAEGAPAVPELVGTLTLLADLYLRTGDLAAAAGRLDEARDLAERVGPAAWDLGGVARTEGEIALRGGDYDGAARIARDALGSGAAGQPAARLWNLLGLACASRGDFDVAIDAFSEELRLWNDLGNEAAAAVVHGNLAEALLRTGDTSAAASHQLECLQGATDVGRPLLVAFSMTLAAHLAAQASEWQAALELQGASDVLLEEAGYALYEPDELARSELVERGRASVGDEASTWLAAGRSLALVDAAERASQVLADAAGPNA